MIRSLLLGCLMVMIALGCFFSGMGELKRANNQKKISFDPFIPEINPDRDFAIRDPKSFAILVYAHNSVDWCERALTSVFEQDYDRYRVIFVDDGSVDGTFEKAQQFIVQNQQDSRVIAIRNETALGPIGSLYRASDYCQDGEIIVPLDANNWFAHDKVLIRFNQVFQNPDTWMLMAQGLEYPSYQIVEPPVFTRSLIEKKGFRSLSDFDCPSVAFYASLFKSIHLPQLFVDGRFSQLQLAYAIPLLEQAGGRFRVLSEPFIFENRSFQKQDKKEMNEISIIQSQDPYRPLTHFPKSILKENSGVDIVLFSFDRPMQLYAALESIHHYITGFHTLNVIYRVSDQRFNDAYNLLKTTFSNVHFIKQSENPRKDFKPLLIHTIFDSPSEYILFGIDDMIIKDFVDLNFCRQMLEKTGAYGFYLRFGCHINISHLKQKLNSVPASVLLSNGVFAWDFRNGESDWAFPNTVDMTLYRKRDLKKAFSELKYKNPNSLESNWARNPPQNTIGLYFEHSKMVNVPLNVVNQSDCPHMNFMTTEELLVKFDQGFKIDIDPFHQIENPSPHCDYTPEFIPR